MHVIDFNYIYSDKSQITVADRGREEEKDEAKAKEKS